MLDTPATSTLSIRTLEDTDLPAFCDVLANAFLLDTADEVLERESYVHEPARSHGVFDGDQLVGIEAVTSRALALPGTGFSPVAAVTAIAVLPGHRRRGVLTMMMRTELDSLHEAGEPIAVLWASEGGIYGRFGYGLATTFTKYAIPARTPFRPDIAVSEQRVRDVARDAAVPMIKDIYRRLPTRAGRLDRGDGNWGYLLQDDSQDRAKHGALRFAVHPGGYAVYRARLDWQDRGPRGVLRVRELAATSPAGYAAIWRYLLDFDLIGEVVMDGGVDEPIGLMLADPRAALRHGADALWLRLVDLDRALPARSYSRPLEVVLAVTDTFCPWNAGRWRLSVGGDGRATVARTDAAADLALACRDLGAAFLGGIRLTALAEAGLVHELTPGTLAATSAAFQHDAAPACLEAF